MPVEAMESWTPDIEDGLALFQHMRAGELRNYLNNCNDDIEEIKYEGGLSTFRISGSTPTRKGGGLLISDIEKSDYDWLLTPPGTPLFPSLDQETAGINFSQRTTLMCSGSASKSSKDPSLKPLSESPSPCPISLASSTRNTKSTYSNPSPQRSYAVSPARPSTSSNRARSPSASPMSSLTRSRLTTGSPSRSITSAGRSPAATASKSTQKSLTPTMSRNNTSPSSVSRCGYLAHKGPRRSLSPNLGPWEPIMAVLSTEPLPNLRTSPSSRSLQRGKSEYSGQGITTSKHFATRDDAQCAIELVAPRNRNKSSNNTSEISRVSTKCADSKYGSSPARRQPQSTTCTKEMICSFANGKLMERQMPSGRNSQNMFRPLMSSAPSTSIYRISPDISNSSASSPSVLPSTFMYESPKQNMRVSPERGCSHNNDEQGKDLQNNWSIFIDPGNLEGIENSENDLSHAFQNCCLLQEATKDPIKSETKPREETGLSGVWDKNKAFVFEDTKDDSACKDIQIAGAHEFTHVKSLNSDTDVNVRDLDHLMKGISRKHRKHILLAHSFSGESEMQNVRFTRGKRSEQSIEDNKMFASNKIQSPLRYKLSKGDVEPSFESFSTQAFKNCTHAGSQDAARSTNFYPVRRQLCMKNADMGYGMWNMKKAGSFDISTSDSYSCSESLDSSYIDNHTEKFSEDLSEVDSMSHTGYSLSTSSITNHSLHNLTCSEKPSTEIPTELGTGEVRFISVSGGLEGREKEQNIQSRKQSQVETLMDLSELWASSADFQNQAVADEKRISTQDVLSLLNARNMKSMEIKQSTSGQFTEIMQSAAGKLSANLDVKGEYATKMSKVVADDGDRALKSIFAGTPTEGTSGWDGNSKKVQLQASPLRRNVTLEEATDTILFCSSIVHEIVYNAATLGEEKCNSSTEASSRVWGHISGPTPLWRTSKSWRRDRREPACNRAQQLVDLGVQPRMKHVPTSNKALSAHEAGKTNHRRKKKALCGFGFCRVI